MKQLATLLTLLLLCAATNAADYYVSQPLGKDTNPGTLAKPFRTLAKAASILKPGDTCYVRKGTYAETLTPRVSGELGKPITYAQYKDEEATIFGCNPVTGWKPEGDGVFSAALPWSLDDGNQVFWKGTMLHEAAFPATLPGTRVTLFNPGRATVEAGTENTLTCSSIPGTAADWKGAQLWCGGGSRWIFWNAKVEGYDAKKQTLTFSPKQSNRWYTPRKGNPFVLRGVRAALKHPGQWYYDKKEKRLYVIPPNGCDGKTMKLSVKKRQLGIDLSGKSHIQLRGLNLFAAGILADAKSSDLVLEKVTASHVAHSYLKPDSPGVSILGKKTLLLSCTFGVASGPVLKVTGTDNRVINCHIHRGGYAAGWKGTVFIAGRRLVFSHNTVEYAGRDLVNTHGLTESLVQFNDVSKPGLLTQDLGMFYGHNTDFGNTEFCYNYVHDNLAKGHAPGIYFDHLSSNILVHHNVIRNSHSHPIQVNNPGYACLVYNNSALKCGKTSTFDHSRRQDLSFSRWTDNILNAPISLPDNVYVGGNVIDANPPYADAMAGNFQLTKDLGNGVGTTTVGAIPFGGKQFKTGCDLKNPPNPLPVYRRPNYLWMNHVRNSCFEFGELGKPSSPESWKTTGAGNATTVEGNGWGNKYGDGKVCPTGTMKAELRLGPKKDGVEQVVSGLLPGKTYVFSVWLKTSDAKEVVRCGVRDYGGEPKTEELRGTTWARKKLLFTTGANSTRATIFVEKSDGVGFAWADNLVVQYVEVK